MKSSSILFPVNSNNYVIAIPSYNRADILKTKTFATLKRHNIPDNIIYIFVANNDEREKYIMKIDIDPEHIIIGLKGLKNQRNFISSYFPEGEYIVQLDDDIDEIVELIIPNNRTSMRTSMRTAKQKREMMKKHKIKPITNLNKFIVDAFNICVSKGIYLWGIYPVDNPYFMTDTITTDLRFIVGPFWGIINRHSEQLKLSVDEKENVERTLQYYIMDGGVIRFNNISITTNYYKTPGGMQTNSTTNNRRTAAQKSAELLHAKYPQYTKIITKKRTNWPEIKLVKTTKKLSTKNTK
jgi:hypothetical protein